MRGLIEELVVMRVNGRQCAPAGRRLQLARIHARHRQAHRVLQQTQRGPGEVKCCIDAERE